MALKNNGVRQQLIQAGIQEISRHGLQNFSIRRIASECGVSCAAPYKHFKDKEDLIAAVINYIETIWRERQAEIIRRCEGDKKRCLVEISVGYVRFLVENPQFRSIIMTKYAEFDQIYNNLRGRMTDVSLAMVDQYCMEVDMPPEVRRRKLYVVRSLIYGAALMFDNGEMVYDEENIKNVEYSIEREFALP